MRIKGIVIRGRGRGGKLGFPTANISLRTKIKSGVYRGRVVIHYKLYRAGIFVSRDEKRLEAHIIGFKGNLLGKKIEIEMGEKIRRVRNFKDDRELMKQIAMDIKKIVSEK